MNKEQLKQKYYDYLQNNKHLDSHSREVIPLWKVENLIDLLLDIENGAKDDN